MIFLCSDPSYTNLPVYSKTTHTLLRKLFNFFRVKHRIILPFVLLMRHLFSSLHYLQCVLFTVDHHSSAVTLSPHVQFFKGVLSSNCCHRRLSNLHLTGVHLTARLRKGTKVSLLRFVVVFGVYEYLCGMLCVCSVSKHVSYADEQQ